MIIDLNGEPFPTGIFDVVIAGAGIAGIALATKLALSKRVLLLEGGGHDRSQKSQDLYKGLIVGSATKYAPLDTGRVRSLGGTSSLWGGICIDLDDIDFEYRNYIPDSGWPITKSSLSAYQTEAFDILEVEGYGSDGEVPKSGGSLLELMRGISAKPRIAEKFHDRLKKSENLYLVLNANLTDINLDKDTRRVRSFSVRAYVPSSKKIDVLANQFVLSMGTIETVRTLLNSRIQIAKGIGNDKDLVGRYYMDHPAADIASFVFTGDSPNFFRRKRWIKPSAKFLRTHEIGNFFLDNSTPREPSDESERLRLKVKDLACSNQVSEYLIKKLVDGLNCDSKFGVGVGRFSLNMEQVPNRDSRITLSKERDVFGNLTAQLDWKLSPIDRKTLRIAALEIGRYFAHNDIGRVRLEPFVTEHQELNTVLGGGCHQMGGTRMGRNPTTAVVDENCRVFGTDNLFVASCSVFPTAGAANPTLTLVKLTLRLAAHLLKK